MATRPGRPWRLGPLPGESGRGRQPGNPGVTSFPPRSRYSPAGVTGRRAAGEGSGAAPRRGREPPDTACAQHPGPAEFTPPGTGPSARREQRIPSPSGADPGTRAGRYCRQPCGGRDKDSSLAGFPAAAAASRLRARSRSTRASGRRRCGRAAPGAELGAVAPSRPPALGLPGRGDGAAAPPAPPAPAHESPPPSAQGRGPGRRGRSGTRRRVPATRRASPCRSSSLAGREWAPRLEFPRYERHPAQYRQTADIPPLSVYSKIF